LFAKKLGLNIIDYLIPLSNNSIESYGMGLICKPNISHITKLNQNNQLGYWVEKISSEINSPVKFTNNESGLVNNIAIICGSGSSFLDEIIKKNEKLSNEDKIDTFITADISYHTFHRCRGVINMIDVGHYEMEQFVPDGMYKIIKEKYENYTSNSNIIELDTQNKIKFYLSKVLTNPVDFYPNLNYKENQLNYLLNH
jgi:putative NIF3 family GTP cyclohydrolase 1 type 2